MEETVAKVPANSPLSDSQRATVEPVVIAPQPGEPPIEGEPPKPDEPKPFQFQHKPTWEQLEKDGIAIPDEFKKGNFGDYKDEWNALRSVINENTTFDEEPVLNDPFLENYQKLPPEQRQAYVKNYNQAMEFFDLQPADGLKAWYQTQTVEKDGKKERKYEDKAIDAFIEKMSPIELDREWSAIKGAAKQQFDQFYSQTATQSEADRVKRLETENKNRVTASRTILSELKDMKDYGGVPLTDDIKKSAERDFILLTQINPSTGQPHLIELLNDNKTLMRFVLANRLLAGKAIDDYITAQNEMFKNVLVDEKLDIAPKPKTGVTGRPTAPNTPKP